MEAQDTGHTIGTVWLDGDESSSFASCSECDETVFSLGTGAMERAEEWAFAHVCKDS